MRRANGIHVLGAGFTSVSFAIIGTFAPGGPEILIQSIAVLLPPIAVVLDERRAGDDADELDEVAS